VPELTKLAFAPPGEKDRLHEWQLRMFAAAAIGKIERE